MTTPHKLFATWKNQVGMRRSLALAAVAVECGPRCQDLFEFAIFPSMTALASVAAVTTSDLVVGAQNVVWDDTNSFTGETSASDLSDIGCKYVIIGHSERRLYLGETEAMIGHKVATACSHLLIPVLCVGETFDVASCLAEPDIDGGLVGKASQEPASFRALVDATAAAYVSQPGAH